MRFAIQTLNRYLKKPRTTEEIVSLLGRTEIEVEEVIKGKTLDPGIILAKVLDVQPHPNADRLRLVTVTAGQNKHLVVCGAPNVAVEQRVALVQPGSTLPDGTLITEAVIRGQSSHGMLASSKELGLSDDHSGILVVEESPHRLGTPLCDIVFATDVLDIKTPANRWDYLSGVGVAREISAYDKVEQALIEPETGEYDYQDTEWADVKVRGAEGCSRFVSARVKLKNDVKTPAWLVDNLLANGYVSHNAVVDITNFVMLETGQPSHAYDAHKLTGALQVRLAIHGETITTLDGKNRELTEQDIVIADDKGPVGLAGVMGSAHTEIDTATTEIVLEAAQFDKSVVRRAALRHGLRTEASARFERGLPLPLSRHAFSRLLDLLQEICGAELIDSPVDQLMGWPWQQFLGVRIRSAEQLLGLSLDEAKVVKGLRRLGFEVEHFSLVGELKKHLGKPYKWGANYKQDGEAAFDCSYLVDRLYSRLGVQVGHTALGQYHNGTPVDDLSKLKPGDVLFTARDVQQRPIDEHYFETLADGTKQKRDVADAPSVGHNGIYIGNGQIIHAGRVWEQDPNGEYQRTEREEVSQLPLELYTESTENKFFGARRYVESLNHILAVTVPWWRTDVRLEVDMVEEIAKLVGYEAVPTTLPSLPPMAASEQSELVDQMALRRLMVGLGGTEVSTYSFISQADVEGMGVDPEDLLSVANPRSPEQAYLRPSLLASHLHLWSRNRAVKQAGVVFEVSRVFRSRGLTELPDESAVLGLSAHGPDSLELVQATVHALLAHLHIDPDFNPTEDVRLVSQRAASLGSPETPLGVIGQLRTDVAQRFDVPYTVAWCELDLARLFAARAPIVVHTPPAYQLVTRDVSLEVAETVSWQQLRRLLSQQKAIFSVHYVGRYQDATLQKAGRHALTAQLRFDLGSQPQAAVIDKLLRGTVQAVRQALPDSSQLEVR